MATDRQAPSALQHLRDILLLPFTVTVVVPYLIYESEQGIIPAGMVTMAVGAAFFITGLGLFIYTVSLFRTFGKGTLAPWTPTQKLVVRGPYRYCRNPMITGVFFMLLGETLFLRSTNLLCWTGAFFLINTLYFILKEEPDLRRRFGEEYEVYKEKVPRWIPRLRPYMPSGEG